MPIASETACDPLKVELKNWLEANKHMNGAVILQYLIKYANLVVHVSFIDQQVYCRRPVERWPLYGEACVYGLISTFEEAQMADPQTREECAARIKKLITKYQACAEINDEYGAEKALVEIRPLQAYLKQVQTPGKTPKRFPPPWAGACRMVNNNMTYLIRKMEAGRPDLAEYVKKHLKRGKAFQWFDPDDEDSIYWSAAAHWTHESI